MIKKLCTNDLMDIDEFIIGVKDEMRCDELKILEAFNNISEIDEHVATCENHSLNGRKNELVDLKKRLNKYIIKILEIQNLKNQKLKEYFKIMKLKYLLEIYQGDMKILLGQHEQKEIIKFHNDHNMIDIKYKNIIDKICNKNIYTSYVDINGVFTVVLYN